MASDGGKDFTTLIDAAPEVGRKRPLREFAESRNNLLLELGVEPEQARWLTLLGLTTRVLNSLAESDRPARRAAARVFRTASELSGVEPDALRAIIGRLALRDPERLTSRPDDALRIQLRLMEIISSMPEVSLWTREIGRPLRCVGQAGSGPSRGVRAAAARALRDGDATPATERRTIVAAPIAIAAPAASALAGRVPAGGATFGLAMFDEASALLGDVLERNAILSSAEERAHQLTGAAERRLTRLGFDLHDGPAQGVTGLLADLHLFEAQLSEALAGHPDAEILEGRVEDLKSRALGLGTELREVARTAQAPATLRQSVGEVVRAEARAFAQATGIKPEVTISGPVDTLTPSQRIALLRGIQEALRNAREHARPRNVSVQVAAHAARIDAEVRDDGRGFNVDRALSRAARGGRMGLVGIAERVRLLGGRCDVRSRRGGPTSVRITVPRWNPESPPKAATEPKP